MTRHNAADQAPDPHVADGIRLQKVLSQAGVASRRASENLIVAGRVSVDNQVVTTVGIRVDPASSVIHVDGERIQTNEGLLTVALHKPPGVVSTLEDPDGRSTVAQYVADYSQRLNHVGRLDIDSEGLLLLSNDGELTHRLTHPSYEVPKRYTATVEGRLPKSAQRDLLEGVMLEDGEARADSVTIKATAAQSTLVDIVLHEGRNRIVRRIFDHIGFPVSRLVRTQMGTIRLGELRPGRTRVISGPELTSLMTSVGM